MTKRETITKREKKVGNDGQPVSQAEGPERTIEGLDQLLAAFLYDEPPRKLDDPSDPPRSATTRGRR